MKKYLSAFAALTLLFAFVACSEKENMDNETVSGFKVTVSPTITKVTETHFEEGDAIGLAVLRESGVWKENAKLIYDGSVFSGDSNWYLGDDVSVLKAYYPYSPSFPTSFSVSTDQRNGISSSDFISAVKTDVEPTNEAVPMVFSHKFSRILINLDNQSGGIISGVTLCGSVPTAIIDENLDVSVANASAEDIKAYKASDTQYRIIVVPQTVKFTVKVSVDDVEQTSLLSSVDLQSGEEYNMNIVVLDSGIKIIVTGEINSWNQGGDIVGDGEIAMPEAVDLGLSVKWASFNIGAFAPEEHGDYFAWGEIETKSEYNWETYKYGASSSSLTKYNLWPSHGTVDNLAILEAEDDVAYMKFGGDWRMPTREEIDELLCSANCDWENTTLNGVRGYRVTSKRAGYTDKWLFLPNSDLSNPGSGRYWSSSLCTGTPDGAFGIYFFSSNLFVSYFSRKGGLTVRPVFSNDGWIYVSSLQLNHPDLELYVGESEAIIATVLPANASNSYIDWYSTNTNIATVSSTGIVTAIAEGDATIFAEAKDGSGERALCNVVVHPVSVP